MFSFIKSSILLTLVLLLLSPIFSKGQATRVLLYEGKIGKASVVMELTLNGSEIFGTYYYKRFKKSIELQGKYVGPKTIELVFENGDATETFLLKDIGSETESIYSGTWKNGTSKAPLPVSLKEADFSKVIAKNAYVKYTKLSEYDYSILADIQFKQDSIQKINTEFSITWLRDTLSNFSSFRINKNGVSKSIDSINIFLERLHFSELLSYLDCPGSDYNSFLRNVYIRNHVLSFALSVNLFCGGAHPDFATSGYTFNIETGLEMELTDFLFFGKTKKDYKESEDYKLGGEVMEPNVVKLLTKLYPDDMKKPTDEDENCDYSDPDVWDYTAWYLTEAGLYLYPSFYRAARACDGADFSVIPYTTLIKYKNPAVVIPMKY